MHVHTSVHYTGWVLNITWLKWYNLRSGAIYFFWRGVGAGGEGAGNGEEKGRRTA